MKLVIDLKAEHVYLTIIAILMILQIYQFYLIQSIKKSIMSIWNQIGVIALTVSTKIMQIEKNQEENNKN